jgi:hypothetical protein
MSHKMKIISSTRFLLSVVLFSCVAACTAVEPKNVEPSGLATVRAKGGGVGNFLAMALLPIGEVRNLEIQVINGRDPNSFGNSRQVRLPPGHYNIGVQCAFNVDRQLIYANGAVNADLVADHRYEITGELPANRSQSCVVRVVDVTKAT